jgi:drug/metabolite transporter (DMT)-like permease
LKENRITVTSWIILAVLTLVWGSSFILIKMGLEHFSSTEVGAMRIAISFLFLLPFALPRVRKIRREEWKYLVLVGIIGSGLPAFLFAMAQKGIDSSLAGILNSLTPLFTLIIGLSFFSSRVKWFNILGVIMGLAGAVALVSISGGHSFDFNIRYAVYIVIATICYAFNVNIIKYRLADLHPVTITSISFMLIGLPALLHLIVFTGFIPQLKTDPEALAGLGYIAILAVIGTGLALMLFNTLIKMSSPVFASSVTYLIPVVAVIWGISDGETISWTFILWIFLILAGVFLVNKKSLLKKSS